MSQARSDFYRSHLLNKSHCCFSGAETGGHVIGFTLLPSCVYHPISIDNNSVGLSKIVLVHVNAGE